MKIHLKGPISTVVARLFGGAFVDQAKSKIVNLSGIWKLSLEESDFGGSLAPRSVHVAVEHHEPFIRYFGLFVDREGQSAFFDIECRLDGLPHFVDGFTILSERIDSHTMKTERKSLDLHRTETTVMQVSPDGSMMVVERQLDGPGESYWCTEVYEKDTVAESGLSDGTGPFMRLRQPESSASPLEGIMAALARGRLSSDRIDGPE